ncbi:unnamed protein product [Cladocopium goreaui]|uniref:Uncharacterized protein n=1 Tax=Cladocopium goreaui TaxID=2562237 RepID=A0A9P1GMF5_9DINO|nr:unnamed protein product [Cladocopium goreaui]
MKCHEPEVVHWYMCFLLQVTCENFEISQGCNLSQGVIFAAWQRPSGSFVSGAQEDRGWPVHEDVASTFWTNGAADWVQLSALGLITWWLVSYFVMLYVAIRLWDANPQASKDAIAQGTLRHAVGIALVVLAYFSGWGSPRRGGWFYGPYCPYGEEQDADRLTFSYWCFLSCAVLHVTICTVAAMFHSVVVRRALYPEHIVVVSRSQVWVQRVWRSCLAKCSVLPGTDDLRLKTWKQAGNEAGTQAEANRGTIQSLGYSFYAKLKAQAFWKEVDFGYLQLPGVCNLSLGYILKIQDGDLKPLKEGSVQVYQVLSRINAPMSRIRAPIERADADHCDQVEVPKEKEKKMQSKRGDPIAELRRGHRVVLRAPPGDNASSDAACFFSNLLLLVNSACVRLEKRVRMLPQHELEKLCHDCYTLSTSHLSRPELSTLHMPRLFCHQAKSDLSGLSCSTYYLFLFELG